MNMIKKLKKTMKKEKGLKAKLVRQQFYHALKNGKPVIASDPSSETAEDILARIRNRRGSIIPKTNPYDASANGIIDKIKKTWQN